MSWGYFLELLSFQTNGLMTDYSNMVLLLVVSCLHPTLYGLNKLEYADTEPKLSDTAYFSRHLSFL